MKFQRFIIAPLLAFALLSATGSLCSNTLVHAHSGQDEQPERPPAFHYICPMHDDVTSKKPGKCRKCKMKLEKKRIKAAKPSDQ